MKLLSQASSYSRFHQVGKSAPALASLYVCMNRPLFFVPPSQLSPTNPSGPTSSSNNGHHSSHYHLGGTTSTTHHFFLEILRYGDTVLIVTATYFYWHCSLSFFPSSWGGRTKHGVWHMWIWFLGEPEEAKNFKCEIAIKKKNRDEDTELKERGN